jgi:hypothetical protein
VLKLFMAGFCDIFSFGMSHAERREPRTAVDLASPAMNSILSLVFFSLCVCVGDAQLSLEGRTPIAA